MAAPQDGHTILFTAPTFLFVPYLNTDAGYAPLQDFVPAARIVIPTYLLAASPLAPFKSFRELADLGKRGGAKVNLGVAGSHSAAAASGMAKAAGFEVNIVHYKTNGQMINDAIGGHIPLVLASLSTLNNLARDGRLRALAVSGATRSIVAPEVPTAMESGAKGFAVTSWTGAFVRSGTPDAIIAAITAGIRKATSEDDFLKFCHLQGIEPAFEAGSQWAKELPREQTYLAELLRQSGILTR